MISKLCVFLFVVLVVPVIAYAKRGCCSYHGGVYGCNSTTGQQVCRDGTTSRSCYYNV